MSSTAQKTKTIPLNLFIYVSILFLLLLASNNINNFLSSNKVLGATTENIQIDDDAGFWKNFLLENPNYAPGWKEVGRNDKVREIDPNFEINNN